MMEHVPQHLEVKFHRLYWTWALWAHPFEVRAENVTVRDKEKGWTASAAHLGVSLSFVQLLRGQWVPSFVYVDQPTYVAAEKKRAQDKQSRSKDKTTFENPLISVFETLSAYAHPFTAHITSTYGGVSLRYKPGADITNVQGRGRVRMSNGVPFLTTPLIQSLHARASFNLSFQKKTRAISGLCLLEGQTASTERFTASLALKNDVLAVQNCFFRGQFINFRVHGKIALHGEHLVDLALSTPYMTMEKILHAWPREYAQGAYTWLSEQVSAGEMRAELFVKAPLMDLVDRFDAVFKGRLELKDAVLSPVPGMDEIKGVNAHADLTAKRLNIHVNAGHLKGQRLSKVDVVLDGLDTDDETLRLTGTLAGDVQEALSLVSKPPFDYIRRVPLSLKSLQGQIETTLTLACPLLKEIPLEKVQYQVDAHLKDGSYTYDIKDLGKGVSLTEGTLHLHVAPDGVRLEGQANYLGTPVTLKLFEPFQAEARGEIEVKAPLHKTHLEALFPTLSLPTPFDFTLRYRTGALMHFEGDFSRLALDKWLKPVGNIGKIAFDLERTKDANTLRNIEAVWNKTSLRGFVEFDTSWNIKSANAQISEPHNHAWSMHFQRQKVGGAQISITGKQFSGVMLKKLLEATSEGGEMPDWLKNEPVDITIKLDRLDMIASHQKPLSVDGLFRLTHTASGWAWGRCALVLKSAQGASFTLRRETSAKYITWRAQTQDLGYFMDGLDLIPDMHKGRMSLECIAPQGTERFTGRLKITDFSIKKTPFLQRFFMTFLSPAGFVRMLSGGRLTFSLLDGDLAYQNGLLDVNKLFARGDTTIIMRGWINFDKELADLRGDMIPAYSLNRFLGSIPLVGSLVVGGKEDGLLSTHFTMKGPLKNMKIQANPFQMITPGFLKRHMRNEDTKALKKSKKTSKTQST